jgi:nucleoside-triphosphatase THEP1
MRYTIPTYFEEREEDSVEGFTIIDTDENEGYHIAEKWCRESDEVWMQYWVPAEELERRAREEACAPVTSLTDEQFEKVCDKFTHSEISGERRAAL